MQSPTEFTSSSKLSVLYQTAGFSFPSAVRLALLREIAHTGDAHLVDDTLVTPEQATAILCRFIDGLPELEQQAHMRRDVACLIAQVESEDECQRFLRERLATAA